MTARVIFGLLAWASAGATAWACPVCFRMEEGPVTAGVRAAVIVMMTVTVSVLAGFAIFIRGFVQRSRTPELRNLVEPRNFGTSQPRNR
jgi:hypothetical protein